MQQRKYGDLRLMKSWRENEREWPQNEPAPAIYSKELQSRKVSLQPQFTMKSCRAVKMSLQPQFKLKARLEVIAGTCKEHGKLRKGKCS